MLIEQSAYANRWRPVSPAAKGVFALAGFVAAFAARTPTAAPNWKLRCNWIFRPTTIRAIVAAAAESPPIVKRQ